jgi:O-antigen ligase
VTVYAPAAPRFDKRRAAWVLALVGILAIEGIAATHSYVWAAPLVAVLVIAVAVDLPLVPVLGAILVARILTDASLSSPGIRSGGAVNLSAAIALLFLLVAIGLLIRRRRGVGAALLAALWLGLWTMVAIRSHGASTATIREGIREASILALGLIVYNSRGAIGLGVAARVLQVAGAGGAVLAIHQLATHTGVTIDGQLRSNGTFIHPDGAAMFFAVATVASVWRYLDLGRGRLDLLLAVVFGAATIATFSLAGLASLLAMLIAYGALRPGSMRTKLRAFGLAALLVVAFLATPLGAERIANESSAELNGSRRSAESSSLAWRIYKWGMLVDEWEEAPLLGHGLGSTVTTEAALGSTSAEKVPHNEYLRYLVETGVIGLGLLLAALVLLIRQLARRRPAGGETGRSPEQQSAAALGIAVVVGCMVNGLADNTFLYTTSGYAVALIVAAALAAPPRRREAPARLAASPSLPLRPRTA